MGSLVQYALAVKHRGRKKADLAATMHVFNYFGAHVHLLRTCPEAVKVYIGSFVIFFFFQAAA